MTAIGQRPVGYENAKMIGTTKIVDFFVDVTVTKKIFLSPDILGHLVKMPHGHSNRDHVRFVEAGRAEQKT